MVVVLEDHVSTKTGTKNGTSGCHGYSYIQMKTVWLIATQIQPFRCCQIKVKSVRGVTKKHPSILHINFKKFNQRKECNRRKREIVKRVCDNLRGKEKLSKEFAIIWKVHLSNYKLVE